MPLFAVTLDRWSSRRLTGADRGFLLATLHPLSDSEGAASVLDDLGRRIAAERAKHGIPAADPSKTRAIRHLACAAGEYLKYVGVPWDTIEYRGKEYRRLEGEDDWTFAARVLGDRS